MTYVTFLAIILLFYSIVVHGREVHFIAKIFLKIMFILVINFTFSLIFKSVQSIIITLI